MTLPRFLFVTSMLLAACDDTASPDTPRSPVSAPLAGAWFTGTLSTIQYYDRDTGEFQDPSGEGFYFVFAADGTYETGAVISSTVGGCTMRLLGDETGTLTVAGADLTVYRHRITTHVTNSCGASGDRTQGEETRHLRWSIAPDASGLEWLSLAHDDGTVETYRRWR